MLSVLFKFPVNLCLLVYLAACAMLLSVEVLRDNPRLVAVYILATFALAVVLVREVRERAKEGASALEFHRLADYPGKTFYVGKRVAFNRIGDRKMFEKILSAAMLGRDGSIYAGDNQATHDQIRHFVRSKQLGPVESYGFLTTHGRYVDTIEAWDIAVDACQISHVKGTADGELTCEMLYPKESPQPCAA